MRKNLIYIFLVLIGLSVAGWQAYEHQRVKEFARRNMASRAHDLSAALSVVMRSQGRMAFIPRPRIEAALNELVHSTELESVVLLNASGDAVASSGKPLPVKPEVLLARHEYWTRDTASFANLVALGPGTEGYEGRTAVLPADGPAPPQGRGRPHPPGPGPREGGPPPPGLREHLLDDPRLDSVLSRSSRRILLEMMDHEPLDAARVDTILGLFNASAVDERLKTDLRGWLAGRPLNHETLRGLLMRVVGPPPGPPPEQPPWMNKPDYDRLVKEHGIHWFLVTLPTGGLRAILGEDLRLRGIVLGGTLLACLALALAWRTFRHSADLEIQLVRERETAARLRDMNVTAAGLVHETKNPLNLIRGMAQMIGRRPDTPGDIRKTASNITEETDRVTGRLNQFLNYARPVQPEPQPVDLNGLVQSVFDVLAFDCEEKNVVLEATGPRLSVWADEGMLRQTLFNLLLNAVQAVPNGGHVTVQIIAGLDKTVRLEVRDDGPGIAIENCEEVFRPYYTTSEKGTGLGLAVVRQIAHAHHWTVDCQPGDRGAVFRVSGIRLAKTKLRENTNG
ncbi:MAG TPA: ATP-binding protein [Candidatus Hydrogenedentes bacterium]|nr:ATP-binding protein [Candidatus Hydrogenedentota bacterium]